MDTKSMLTDFSEIKQFPLTIDYMEKAREREREILFFFYLKTVVVLGSCCGIMCPPCTCNGM